MTTAPITRRTTTTDPDREVLRWGGFASLGGGLLLLFVFGWVLLLAGPEPDGVAGPIERFPDIEYVRVVENGLCLAVFALWAFGHLALHRRLARVRPAAALAGTGTALLGLGVMAAGALPHAATSRLADRYDAAGTTAADRTTLALVWQGTQGVFEALLLAGVLLAAAGTLLVGLALRADADLRRCGTLATVLGGTGLVAGGVTLAEPTSTVLAVGVLALLAFHLVIGPTILRHS